MTTTLRRTLDHSVPAGVPEERVHTGACSMESLRTLLGRALLLNLSAGPGPAALELSALDQADVAPAIDVLTEATAGTLSQLERRATFPIPLGYVVDRLDAFEAADREVSMAFVHRATFANAGVDVDVDELLHAYGPGDALYGAFDATSAVIRFAARRWWRPAAVILRDLELVALTDRSGSRYDRR